jgi:hypothetical protein
MIARGYQFQPEPDPFVQYGQMQQLEQNRQTNALNQMKMQEMQRGVETTNALNKFLPGLNESNRSQLLGYGAAGQSVYKTLAEGDTQQRLRDQAKSQAALNKSNILKNVVEQTRDAVARLDPNDAAGYMALRKRVLDQYPDLTVHMPEAFNADVQQRLLATAASVLEGQKPEPSFTLSAGQTRYPKGYMGVVTAPAAAAATAKPPDKITIMTNLGYPLTPAGNEAYETAIRAKSTVSAPTGTLAEMEATGIPKTQEGLALYYRLKEKAPVVAPEPTTNEIKNAKAIALGAGPEGSAAYNAVFAKQMARLTAKSGGGGEGGGAGGAAGTGTQKVVDPKDPTKTIIVTNQRAVSEGLTPATAMEGLPVKERQRRESVFPKAKQAMTTVTKTMSTIGETIDRLLANTDGLNGVTGLVYSRTPAVTDAARKADADLEQLANLAFVQGLTELRSASSTGAGVGNVSNKEGDRFENMKSSLKRSQSFEDMKASLLRLKAQAQSTKDIVNTEFADMYEYRQRQGTQAAPAEPSADVSQQRQDANAAIAKGAPAAAVRQRFKQNTGQEL